MANCKISNCKVCLFILAIIAVLLLIAVILIIKENSATAEFIMKYQLQESTFDPRVADILEDVTLVAKPTYTISQNPVVLDLKNESDFEYLYGVGYDLEIAFKDKWYIVPLHDAYLFPLMGYIVHPDTSVETVVDLNNHIDVIPGKYRIIKYLQENVTKPSSETIRQGYIAAITTLK